MGKAYSKLMGDEAAQAERSNALYATKREEHVGQNKTAWRKLETGGTWDEKYKTRLIEEIYSLDIKQKEIKNIRILLIGPPGSGKSSFLNTIASIDYGRLSYAAAAGGDWESLSNKLTVFRPQRRLRNFRLLDTRGRKLEGFNIQDLLSVIKGQVPPDYMFNLTSPINENGKYFKKDPKSKDKVHCLVFVVDASRVGQENISDAIREKVNDLQQELMDIEIPRIVLLTKIDELCKMTNTDITASYRSEAIKKAVDLAEDLFKVPKLNIFPVQNYSGEMETEAKKDILSLSALRQMVFFGTHFLGRITVATSDDEDDEDSS